MRAWNSDGNNIDNHLQHSSSFSSILGRGAVDFTGTWLPDLPDVAIRRAICEPGVFAPRDTLSSASHEDRPDDVECNNVCNERQRVILPWIKCSTADGRLKAEDGRRKAPGARSTTASACAPISASRQTHAEPWLAFFTLPFRVYSCNERGRAYTAPIRAVSFPIPFHDTVDSSNQIWYSIHYSSRYSLGMSI